MFTTALLFGRFHSSFKKINAALRQQPLHHLESLCADRITPDLLACNDTDRERIFTPKLTFLSFLDQVLNPGSSCRSALNQIKAYYQSQPDPPAIDSNTSGFCQARARWTTPSWWPFVAIWLSAWRFTGIPSWANYPWLASSKSLTALP